MKTNRYAPARFLRIAAALLITVFVTQAIHAAQPKAEFKGGVAIGVSRQIVVADTDEEARRIAEPAFAHYHANLTYLWRMNSGDELVVRQAVPAANTFADSEREGTIIAGSPETVRRKITEQATELGLNYLLSYLMFGTLTLDQSLRSLALFKSEVMPALEAI